MRRDGLEVCADCGHSPDKHGARGYGACRHGLVRGVLAEALGIDVTGRPLTVDELNGCRCKRYRVRVRATGGTPGAGRP